MRQKRPVHNRHPPISAVPPSLTGSARDSESKRHRDPPGLFVRLCVDSVELKIPPIGLDSTPDAPRLPQAGANDRLSRPRPRRGLEASRSRSPTERIIGKPFRPQVVTRSNGPRCPTSAAKSPRRMNAAGGTAPRARRRSGRARGWRLSQHNGQSTSCPGPLPGMNGKPQPEHSTRSSSSCVAGRGRAWATAARFTRSTSFRRRAKSAFGRICGLGEPPPSCLIPPK